MKKILKYIAVLFVGIGISAGGTVLAAQISVPSASSVGQLLTSLSTGNWQASTSPTVWGTFTAKNFVATSTTADSVFPRLSVTNSTTTAATSTSLFSTLLRATTGYFTSLFLPSLATPAGTFLAVDASGQLIATTTPSGGSGTPGGSDTQVQFNDGGAFNGESGFTYQKSPTELVTMANGTVSGELRSNSLHETSAGIVGLNLDTTNITAQIGSGGFFKLKDGTSAFELSIDTAALTGNHALGAPDKDGTIAVLSDITNASSTLHTDNNSFTGANRFATLLLTGSTTLQNFTGLNATTSQATSTNFFSTNFFATKAVIGNATATGVIAVQGTGTSTYTGGIRALTAQFDALTAASCDLKADTSGNMYCGTDATGGAGGSSASTTSNFSIYKSGSTYYAYNASTTAVTSNASFSVLLQSVVDVMDAGKGGGSIYIQAGTYHVTSTTTIQGNGTAFDSPGGAIRIWGAGVGATKIVTTGNADFLAFDSVAVPMVSDLTVYMNGTSHAFYADSSNNAVRSMWMFYFANMQITSTSSAGATPIYLGNALRGLFTNIEFTDTAGCAYYYAEGNWNPGDFTFTRSFCELQTTSNLVAFNFGSTTSGGYMNQVHFDMVEAIATGVGQTFMRAAPVKFSSFTNLNAEQFDTLVDGYNVTMKNDWDFNYATHRTGIANLRGCRFGNTLNGVKGLAVLNTCTFKFLESDANFAVVDDMNTDTTAPNIIRGFFGSDAGTASASTSATTLTIFRDISFYGTLDNNLAPSGLAGVFQVYGPLQTRSSKTASSSIRSDATSTFQTGVNISTGCFAIANVCISGGGGTFTSIGPIGALQTGPNVTLATSSTAYAGLTASTTITASGNTITFANTMAGTLGIAAGGTGLSNPGASSAQVLLQFGGAVGGVTQIGAGAQYTVLQSTAAGAGFTADALHLDQSAAVTGKLAYLNGGTGTSTAPQGQLLYGGATAYQSVATTSVTCTGSVSCTSFTAIGPSPITINGTGGGGGGSGIGWSWNSINSLYMSTSTDDLLLGASATSSTAKFEVIDNGLLAWFASTTGATIRPILSVFRNTTTGVSGIGINASTTEDSLVVNGRTDLDPLLSGCDMLGNGTVTTDQLAGQLCDWLALDSVTDGGILMGSPSVGIENNMPFYTILRTGDTTSWAANEGVWIKTHRSLPATTTLVVEALLRNPNTNVATTTGTYVFGLGNVGAGSLTTTAAYAAPTDTCSFQASSTPNWRAVVRRGSTYNAYDDTGVSTSSTQTTFKRFRIQQDLVSGCVFMINGTVVASEAAATSPIVPMQLVLGIGNNTAGVGTVGTSQNHYFNFAELKMWWGRWQPK